MKKQTITITYFNNHDRYIYKDIINFSYDGDWILLSSVAGGYKVSLKEAREVLVQTT